MRLGFTRAILFPFSIHSKMAGPSLGERVSTGEQGVYPTNFVVPYDDQKSTRSRTRSQSQSWNGARIAGLSLNRGYRFALRIRTRRLTLKRTSQTWTVLRNPSPERKPTMKPKKQELERLEKADERGPKREKKAWLVFYLYVLLVE